MSKRNLLFSSQLQCKEYICDFSRVNASEHIFQNKYIPNMTNIVQM